MIRRARPEDHPRVTEIRNSVTENVLGDASREKVDSLYKWFEQEPGVWLWDDNGRILGFSAADTRDGSIWALFVDPGHESRGIGRALIAKACDVLRQAGFATATLSTEEGSRADRFYRRGGWRDVGRNDKGEVVFSLEL